MRSALICVFFTLFIKERSHVAGDDFKPTPIPLDEWRRDERVGRVGTLHDTIQTASPPTVVAIPAHYWEDALRHSVYLTLVRDKIDQLIAKGDVIAPDSKRNHHVSKDVDDQDLWEKIKTASFDRTKEEEPTSYGDVTILARGRLIEESGGFRFAEDDKSSEKCDVDECMDGVKAFWTVKRVRQRDQETSPGRYHYELTFSVMSQMPNKQKKPYELPIRTFTVKETTNNRVEPPQAHQKAQIFPSQISRPERAIWFHKNIVQLPNNRKRQHYSGLDRLFSSLFDDDDEDEPSYETPRRYKQSFYQPSFSQYSKVGYVGGSSSEQHTQIKPLPYPYKPHTVNSHGHPLTTPHMGHIQNVEQAISGGISNPYVSQEYYKAAELNNFQRTTRPAVLPTPLPPLMASPKNSFVKKNNAIKYDTLVNVTNRREIATSDEVYNKIKTPAKVSYFPNNLRPPIYNAPPGVFNTMDKKAFKPMPPLKMPVLKPSRTSKPIDFRPSPQVLDVQFSEPDPLFDTVFRPITVNYADVSNFTEKTNVANDNEKGENKMRKPSVTSNKPPKKHANIKPQRTTTNTPDIITANNNPEQDDDDMQWADILGIFSKTTPMESQKEKVQKPRTTTPIPISTTVTVTSVTRNLTSETPTTTKSTTRKPKKRTRPPSKSNKQEKIKKHKRIPTTATSNTTTDKTLTTKFSEEPNEKRESREKRPTKDLMPQATYSLTSTTKSHWQPSLKSTSTTPFSTIGTSSPSLTTKITPTTNLPDKSEPLSSTARSRTINRFRQSTLILKGTSVKHDKWSVTSSIPEKLRAASLSTSKYKQRRKGSNFHGYISSTPKNLDEERMSHDHIDYGTSTRGTISPKTIESVTKITEITSTVTPVLEETYVTSMDSIEDVSHVHDEKEDYEETRDNNEYIFQKTSDTHNKENNEIIDTEETSSTKKIISTPSYSMPKNKKCKKKHQNLTTKIETTTDKKINEQPTTNIPITTKQLTTPSMFEDLLNDFSFEDTNSEESQTTTSKPDQNKEPSQSNEKYFKINDNLEEFLDSLNNDEKYTELSEEEYEDDDEKEPIFEEEDTELDEADDLPRLSHDDYQDDEKRPFTLLELMAME